MEKLLTNIFEGFMNLVAGIAEGISGMVKFTAENYGVTAGFIVLALITGVIAKARK